MACPLSRWCMASKWLLMLPTCVIERTRVKCRVRADSRGCSSLSRIPGTFEAIGLYGPRISSGAPGLRSQVSMWLGPPQSRTKMHDRSVAPPETAAGLDAGGDGAGPAHREGADTPGLKELAPGEPRRGLLLGSWNCHRIVPPPDGCRVPAQDESYPGVAAPVQ